LAAQNKEKTMNSNVPATNAPVPRELTGWVRKSDSKRSLNDVVESLHLKLLDGPDAETYRRYLDAINKDHAKEGSIAIDDTMAALMIRDLARRENEPLVKDAQLADVVRALRTVLRRYVQSRKERGAGLVEIPDAPTGPVENGHVG
jgi:hypothetical protein